MNSLGEEFRRRLPRLMANISLALAFGAIATLSSIIPANVAGSIGFYSWLALTLIAGAFLVRALFDVLAMFDKTAGLFLARLGIPKRWSKRRAAKDLMFIIATILATAAIFPFFKTLGATGTAIQSATTIVSAGIIFLFVYDITRTFHQIFQEKTGAVSNRIVHKSNQKTKESD